MNKHTPPQSMPFIDLKAQRRRLGRAIDDAIMAVVDHGAYIMGPEIATLESELASFCGAKHVLSCANGTDALALVLMAKELKPGDAVLCPSFTFAATAEVVAWFGATPVFVDVHADTFNLDVASLKAAHRTATENGLRPAGVIAVDLFGLPCDFDPVEAFCAENDLWLLDDAAQAFGATYKGRKLGTIGAAAATSFFPAKPLGCYGDGGAVFTDDDNLIEVLKSLRVHGQGEDKYDNVRIGMNGRMDTIQAAVLIEKLKIFPDELRARDIIAGIYADGLSDLVETPRIPEGYSSTWAQYTIKLKPGQRDAFAARLKAAGIPTAIYYPKPLHRQIAYRDYPVAGNGLPVSDLICEQVISLPMHPYLARASQDFIIETAREALRAI